jgi:hypothetical protein
LAERRLIREERDIQTEKDVEELLFDQRIAKMNPPSGPAAKAPATAPRIPSLQGKPSLGFQGEGKPEANFQDTVLDLANIGDDPGEVSFEAIEEAGGIANIMYGERIDSPVVRPLNDVLSALLGETTSSQRARPEPQEMESWQKGLLFVSDVVAAFHGRTMPSTQLDQMRFRGYSLEDQQNQERYLKGLDFINKFTLELGNLPIEARMKFAIQQSAQTRKTFGEGFGALLITQASERTKQEAMEMFIKNAPTMEDGSADILMKYMTYLTGAGDIEEAQLIAREKLFGSGKTLGALEMDALYFAPSLLEEKLDGFTSELRALGGDNAALANAIASGEKISPSEIINANKDLPENSPFKLDKAVLSTLRMDPGRFAAVLPGMVNAEQQAAEQVAMNNAERSLPITFIGGKDSAIPGDIVTAPGLSKKAAWLMDNNYDRLESMMDMLGGQGGGMSDSNMISLGRDFIKESGSFSKIKMAFKTILAASREPNAPGNVAMIFAFMKSLDPGSVVREGEQETARKARARLDTIKTWVSRNVKGNTLTETQVEQFVKIATGIYGESAREQELRVNRWVQRLDGLKVPRDRQSGVIVDLIGADRALFGEPSGELKAVMDRYQ